MPSDPLPPDPCSPRLVRPVSARAAVYRPSILFKSIHPPRTALPHAPQHPLLTLSQLPPAMAGSTSVMQPTSDIGQHETDTHDFPSPTTTEEDLDEPEKTTIFSLPPEILDLFLENVPPSELQRTALSIQQVFPELAVSDSHIFRHVRVTSSSQLKPLWQRLREDKYEGEGRLIRAVRSFTMATFRGDADIMNKFVTLAFLIAQTLITFFDQHSAPDTRHRSHDYQHGNQLCPGTSCRGV